MKKTTLFLLIGALALMCIPVMAGPALPVKGVLSVSSSPDAKEGTEATVILRLYDRQFAGTKLYEERQTVTADSLGIFVAFVGEGTRFGVPTSITDAHRTLWAEWALASSPGIVREARLEITHKRASGEAITVNVNPSMCFTCGGSYPIFSGSWTVSPANPTERSSSCSGSLITRVDSRPFLCGR